MKCGIDFSGSRGSTAHGETRSCPEEKNSKTRNKTLNSAEGDGKMKRWEEQAKGMVKACGQEGKHQFLLKKVEEEGMVQVKHIG